MNIEERKEKYPVTIKLMRDTFPDDFGLTDLDWDSVTESINEIIEKVFEATKKACADSAKLTESRIDKSMFQNEDIREIFESITWENEYEGCGVNVDIDSILNIKIEDLEL